MLTAKEVDALTAIGRHAVGGPGLYLEIDAEGNRRWVFRFSFQGRRTTKGLGAYCKKTNTLENARSRALELRIEIQKGRNPVELDKTRRLEQAQRTRAQKEPQREPTVFSFRQCADDWYRSKEATWLNPKHKDQIRNTLRDYVYPHFGDKSVCDIGRDEVLQALTPIWNSKPETASRVRQRIESILDYAKATGRRTGDNPASWKGNLSAILPATGTLKRRKTLSPSVEAQRQEGHFRALHYSLLPEFFRELHSKESIGALALKFTILTAARTGMVLAARREQFNLSERTWTVPAIHMKRKTLFRVALSKRAIALIEPLMELDGYLFPGDKVGRPISSGTMHQTLKRTSGLDVTVHGFRSTFRDYIGEKTSFDYLTAEYALAHTPKDATVRAYARMDQLEKRLELMDAWGEYVYSGIS